MSITPAAIVALASGDLANARVAMTPGGIEAQEAAGTAALAHDADRLPIRMRPSAVTRERLENAWGFEFGADVDELFVAVTLPAGWTITAETRLLSYVRDESRVVRASIFYKAAYYDRRADMSIERRYHVDTDYSDDEAIVSVKVKDRKTGTALREFGSCPRKEWDKRNQWEADAKAWLDAGKPQREDPLAYWGDA